MDEIIKTIKEMIQMDYYLVNVLRIEKVPFSIETFEQNGWIKDFVVVILTAQDIESIYYFLGDFCSKFKEMSVKVNSFEVKGTTSACVEIAHL